MTDEPQATIFDQIKKVIKDALEYWNSFLALQQARLASFTLSGILFFFQIFFAAILAFTAFVLFNIALGIWLTHLLGNPLWSISILGLVYIVLAWLVSYKALRWLRNLKS